MKVRFRASNRQYPDLTAGNVYRVIGIEAGDYRLMNDVGRPYLYPPTLFEMVDANEPHDWHRRDGGEGDVYAYPPELAESGFFEDYFDGDRKAVAILHEYLDRTSRPQAARRARSA